MSSRHHARPGAMLVDVLIGIAIFSMIVTGVITILVDGQEATVGSGDRVRGIFLSERAIEGVKAVRDDEFSRLVPGTYGITVTNTGYVVLTDTIDPTTDGYTTQVDISEISSDLRQVDVTTWWDFGPRRTGTSALTIQLSDWRQVSSAGDWSSVSLEGAYIDADTPLFNHAAVGSGYLFVTSETSDGGAGLYVFDSSDLSNPTRVADGFTLGAAGHDVIVSNTHLYVITENTSSEVEIYDISSPSSLSDTDLLATINIPGEGKARTMELFGNTLFVASEEDSAESELFSYDVSTLGSITQLDNLNDPGNSFLGMSLHNGYAYLASYQDTLELRVIDIFDSSDMEPAVGDGYNLSDTQDATDVQAISDYLVLTRNVGSVTEEVYLFDIGSSPVPSSAPYSYEVGGNANAVDSDPTGTYAFLGTDNTGKEFIVLNVADFADGISPEITYYDTATGVGRGVHYDFSIDRAMLLTNTAVIILQPS